jgi:hypothetical protein
VVCGGRRLEAVAYPIRHALGNSRGVDATRD